MSATRDKSSKVAFVYSNLYTLYKQGKEAALNADVPAAPAAPRAPTSGRVLKVEEKIPFALKTREFTPPQFIGKQVELKRARAPEAVIETVAKPESLRRIEASRALDESVMKNGAQIDALKSLRENLSTLNNLQGRLRFMLQELETLAKDEE